MLPFDMVFLESNSVATDLGDLSDDWLSERSVRDMSCKNKDGLERGPSSACSSCRPSSDGEGGSPVAKKRPEGGMSEPGRPALNSMSSKVILVIVNSRSVYGRGR